ncbi:hypothetical protein FOE78_20305 [Microlunatus elymi]|uniref:Calcineurin-like phosphoesterase domain-containing protein n=1 Tax=Microlunatus elymi TaxID=2596828 RepID=A0A516Q3C7_9ACTN|nr:metallophosphoesterase [Microlunatus elymi]QDP97933.1 hypothetical protein FOE78_20305 [Microlunatus elymi]
MFAGIDRSQLIRLLVRGVLTVLVCGLLAAPLAAIWGLGHAEITDYLGANRATIAVDYTGETRIDLGPLGNAYLPLSYGPVGLTLTIHGVVEPATGGSLLSTQTLQSYLNLYNDPAEAITGIRDQLVTSAISHAVVAEIVLVLIMIGWTQRRHFLSARLVRMSRTRYAVVSYFVVMIITATVTVAPPATAPTARYPVTIADDTRFDGMTVDSQLLADVLDRGVKGVRKMAARQNAQIDAYVDKTKENLVNQTSKIPSPAPGEQMIFGISDLHCSLAMTRFWKVLVSLSDPAMVFSSGDDTMNGTATERTCVVSERAIAGDRPFIDVGGNHDSPITERQMKAAGATVLDGKVTKVDDVRFLGDDDPEYNPPFSTDRVQERSETEEQLGKRMIDTAAGRNVDVIMVHQPAAGRVVADAKNPPTKLVAWGHMHIQEGPYVNTHEDGSWTVAMQLGTAGGVAPPTITSFSTPFSTPRTSADGYFFFRDLETGLITGVQPVHCLPDGSVIIDNRIPTGDLADLPAQTRGRLGGDEAAPNASGRAVSPSPSGTNAPS